MADLLPCPFCGGSVRLEQTTSYYNEMHGHRKWWGVVCRNTENLGGTCAIQQRPSASEEAAVERWNRRVPAKTSLDHFIDDVEAADIRDAARWRRLVNASELPFPVLAIADDPENDCLLTYGRKRLEELVDRCDEISDRYGEQP